MAYKMATSTPTQKVTAGALAGAIATIVVFILEKSFSFEIDDSVVVALTTLLTFLVSYFVPPSPQDQIVSPNPPSPQNAV